MNLIEVLLLFFFISIVSSIVTSVIRYYAIRNKLYDVPNSRSSHDIPTPKSGGLSIVLILLVTISISYFSKFINLDICISILVGLGIIAVVGLFDDYKSLSVLFRAVSYISAAILSLYLIGGFTTLSLNNHIYYLGSIGFILGMFFIVWMTNLYNFMDGTDGFAAIQTICAGMFSAWALYLSNNTALSIIIYSLVASTLGFLYWNWPPAKIFMGDVGSCSIGFLFGILAVYTEKTQILSMSVWIVLLSPFIGDATFTLFKRIINKEKWYKAHNTHAYQKLYQLGWTHRELAIGLLIINMLIIWPFAYLTNQYKNLELVMIILTYSLIGSIWLVIHNKYRVQKV